MTVREWFRIQRGALHDRHPGAWKRIDEITTTIVEGHNPGEGLHWVYETSPRIAILIGEDRETFFRRQRLLEQLRLRMTDWTE